MVNLIRFSLPSYGLVQALLQLVSRDVRNLAVAHNDQLSILLFSLLLQALLCQKDSCIYFLLHLLNFDFTHNLYSLHI